MTLQRSWIVLFFLLVACAPEQGATELTTAPPQPEVADLLLIGANRDAAAIAADEDAYAQAQLALLAGEDETAAELLLRSDDHRHRARWQHVRLAVNGRIHLTPETTPPPSSEPAIELGYAVALLAEGFREAGLERLELVRGGQIGVIAELVRAKELTGIDEGNKRRAALNRAWAAADTPLRSLIFPELSALLREMGGGGGLREELYQLHSELSIGSDAWDEVTGWLISLEEYPRTRELAWELATAEPRDDHAARLALRKLSDLTVAPPGELPRLAALAISVHDLTLAKDIIDRLPGSPLTTLLWGEYEDALGRPTMALAQYEAIFTDPALGGLARLYAGVTEQARDNNAAAVEHWQLVTPVNSIEEVQGTYLERDGRLTLALAAYYRGNRLRYSNPTEAVRLYRLALKEQLDGRDRVRCGWRLGRILTERGDYLNAAEALAEGLGDSSYHNHVVFWVPYLRQLGGADGRLPGSNWVNPFFELAAKERWWQPELSTNLEPIGGLVASFYTQLRDPALALLLQLASVADDDLFASYTAALEQFRGEDSSVQAALALAWARRGFEVGNYDPRPEFRHAERALALMETPTAEALGVLPLAYPLSYYDLLVDSCQRFDLDPLLLLALVREESAFDPSCVSRVGATGLTQKMPATGAMLARQLGLAEYDLTNPADSLLLGAAYIAEQVNRYDGNLALALAGYNAGPGNANRWKAAFFAMEPELWLLLRPYDETRRYIIRLVGSRYRYEQLYR